MTNREKASSNRANLILKNSIVALFFSASVILTGCQKEKLLQPNSASTSATNAEAAWCKKRAKVAAYTCPSSISMQGNGSNGGKLKTKILGMLPHTIGVAQTTDINGLSSSGNWISTDKYSSKNVTLLFFDKQGDQVCSCMYDNAGKLIALVNFFVFYDPTFATGNSPIYIRFSITSVPGGLNSFDVEHSGSETGVFSNSGNILYSSGITDYNFTDNSPNNNTDGTVSADNYYRIAARDASGALIGYSEIKVAVLL